MENRESEVSGMTNKEAVKIIVNRTIELKDNPAMQARLMEKHKAGMTIEECSQWLTILAIATLSIPMTERQKIIANLEQKNEVKP